MNEIEAGEDKPRNHGWYYKYCKLDSPLATHQLHFFPIAAPAILRTQIIVNLLKLGSKAFF
jgi:hypothetical protein